MNIVQNNYNTKKENIILKKYNILLIQESKEKYIQLI